MNHRAFMRLIQCGGMWLISPVIRSVTSPDGSMVKPVIEPWWRVKRSQASDGSCSALKSQWNRLNTIKVITSTRLRRPLPPAYKVANDVGMANQHGVCVRVCIRIGPMKVLAKGGFQTRLVLPYFLQPKPPITKSNLNNNVQLKTYIFVFIPVLIRRRFARNTFDNQWTILHLTHCSCPLLAQ